jgi:hypothetical protein
VYIGRKRVKGLSEGRQADTQPECLVEHFKMVGFILFAGETDII